MQMVDTYTHVPYSTSSSLLVLVDYTNTPSFWITCMPGTLTLVLTYMPPNTTYYTLHSYTFLSPSSASTTMVLSTLLLLTATLYASAPLLSPREHITCISSPVGSVGWSVGTYTWSTATLLLVLYQLYTPLGLAGVSLYNLSSWSTLATVILATSLVVIPSTVHLITVTPSLHGITSDLSLVTAVLGLLNSIGSWLYVLVYLTARMWLVSVLHGFCTGSISELMSSVNGHLMVLGYSVLSIVSLSTLAYILIQTYVYLSFVVLYLSTDVISYYSLCSVTLVGLLNVSVYTAIVTLSLAVTSIALYVTVPSPQSTLVLTLDSQQQAVRSPSSTSVTSN